MGLMPVIPTPPRFCALKLSTVILLIYPRFVQAITTFSSGIKSSSTISYSSTPITERLSSPYLSAISWISVLITPSKSFSSARIAFNSAISLTRSACSFSSFSLSKPVRARSLISTIAWACASEKPNLSINPSFAAWVLALARIIEITSSIKSSALRRPCKMWSLSSALLRSYLVLLVTTSSWCFK